MSSFYTCIELMKLGFKSVGKNVLISRKASIYNPKNICIGNHVRIDDFCILSAGEKGIDIGNYIHIASFVSITGKENITLGDFSNIASRTSLYSSNDDYLGWGLMGPLFSEQFKKMTHQPIVMEKHVTLGAGSIVLPGCTFGVGSILGSLSLANAQYYRPFTIYAGIPAQILKKRNENILHVEKQFLATTRHL